MNLNGYRKKLCAWWAWQSASLVMLVLLCIAPGVFAAPTAQTMAQRIPTFRECQTLASPNTSTADKAVLTQTFRTFGMYCSLSSNPFPVFHVFSDGERNGQIRLVMDKNDRYTLEGKALWDALLPDRHSVSLVHILMFAGQIVSLIADVVNSNLDPNEAGHVGARVSVLAAGAAANARGIVQQVEALRLAAHIEEKDVNVPLWLTKLSNMKIDAPTSAALKPAAIKGGPQWMQKATGAIHHILGTMTGNGEWQ